MARRKKALSRNVEGPFFVDSSCIDCGTCGYLAPDHFASTGTNSFIHSQPIAQNEISKALLALVDCPVAAIGAPKEFTSRISNDFFPLWVTALFHT